MKLKCILNCVIVCSIIALTLQVAGLSLTHWMYAPSVKVVWDGKNTTFYQLRGLWQNQDKISKYKVTDQKDIKDASNINISQPFVPKELGHWFTAVCSLEAIGAGINVGALVSACVWYFLVHKSKENCAVYYTLVSLVLAGILELLGVTILIGKIDPNLTSWGGALCGLAGTFCIIAAAFIRYWQQEEYA